jgi:type VI secretion system protein ImpK
MNHENKTVLLPSATNKQEKMTDFQTSQTSFATYAKNMQNTHRGKKEHASHRTQFKSNPFLLIGAPLFKHIDILLHSYDIGEMGAVHSMLTQELNRFTEEAAAFHIDNSQILVARYLLCTFLDEMISSTYWGKENNWANDSLLTYFYHETYGGEKFFQLQEKLIASPANHLHLLELMYVCISLGFEGKYRLRTNGKIELENIRENLYRQIKIVKGQTNVNFYSKQNTSSQRNRFFYKASYPLIAASSALVLLVIYAILSISLSGLEQELQEVLDKEVASVAKMESVSIKRSTETNSEGVVEDEEK